MSLEEAKVRNAAGHQKQWEPGTETALGRSPCLFSLFLSIITYTCFLLHSVCLQSYILKSLFLTEEKHMSTDSELYFWHTWTQRETRPIFAPNVSIKPNMKVMIIIIVTEALVVDNSTDFCVWCLDQLLCPTSSYAWSRSSCLLKQKHYKGPQSLLGQEGASLDLFKSVTVFQNLIPETASRSRKSGYYYSFSFFFSF